MPPFHKSSSLPDMNDIRGLLRNNSLIRSVQSSHGSQHRLQRPSENGIPSGHLNREFSSRRSLQNLRAIIDDAMAIVDSDNDDTVFLPASNLPNVRQVGSDANLSSFQRSNTIEANAFIQPVYSHDQDLLEPDTRIIYDIHRENNASDNDFFIEESDEEDRQDG
jgi:hypothetical protein